MCKQFILTFVIAIVCLHSTSVSADSIVAKRWTSAIVALTPTIDPVLSQIPGYDTYQNFRDRFNQALFGQPQVKTVRQTPDQNQAHNRYGQDIIPSIGTEIHSEQNPNVNAGQQFQNTNSNSRRQVPNYNTNSRPSPNQNGFSQQPLASSNANTQQQVSISNRNNFQSSQNSGANVRTIPVQRETDDDYDYFLTQQPQQNPAKKPQQFTPNQQQQRPQENSDLSVIGINRRNNNQLDHNNADTNQRSNFPSRPSNRPLNNEVLRQQGPEVTINEGTVVGENIKPVIQKNSTIPPNPLAAYSSAVTKFSVNVFKMISEVHNAVISPFSIALVLALLQQGADNAAKEQITTALGMPPDVSATAFRSFTNTIKSHKSGNILKLATKVFMNNDFHLEHDFKRKATAIFDSDVEKISFRHPAKAANDINRWASVHTQSKVKEILNPDLLSPDTQIVLANVVYFKGIWQYMFNTAATTDQKFQLESGEVKTTPFMRIRQNFKAHVDDKRNVNFVIMPFEGNHFSLMLLLPSKGELLSSVIGNLDASNLLNYHTAPERDVELIVPKFSVRTDVNLDPVLQTLGVRNIFSYSDKSLINIGNHNGVSPQISTAVQSATLSIDEKGGTAAAVTAFAAVALAYDEADIVFQADRPFVAVLWDNQLQVPLFMVKVDDPSIS